MSKYNSKKVEYEGITFDSKVEFNYFILLREWLECGVIAGFDIKPTYELIPKYEKYGVKHRAITYTPDFLIQHLNNTIELVDIKGFGTLASDLRRKLFDYRYPELKLTWLSYCKKYGGWVEYNELIRLRKLNKKVVDL